MDQYTEINNLLSKYAEIKSEKIINDSIYASGYSCQDLRDLLETIGSLHVELLERKTYIATIKGGFRNCNYATLAIGLEDDYVIVGAYADEGIINQHTSEDALRKLRRAIENRNSDECRISDTDKKRITIIVAMTVLIAAIVAGIISCLNQKSSQSEQQVETEQRTQPEQELQEGQKKQAERKLREEQNLKEEYDILCESYVEEIESYNQKADTYNSFISSIDNSKLVEDFSPITKLTAETKTYNEYIYTDPDLKKLKEKIQNISNQATEIKDKNDECALIAFNNAVDNYNVVADAYNSIVSITSIDFITDMPKSYDAKKTVSSCGEISDAEDYSVMANVINDIIAETNETIANYLLAEQITNPSEAWVLERLRRVDDITGTEAVTSKKDPNGLLGKEGGYTACIYFTVKGIDSSKVAGTDIVDKGTDAGGAVEVYDTLEHALTRCDYLSQFDNTLLYSGSYTLIGTMVIRTSYQLDDQEQCDMTNQIVEVFTTVDT